MSVVPQGTQFCGKEKEQLQFSMIYTEVEFIVGAGDEDDFNRLQSKQIFTSNLPGQTSWSQFESGEGKKSSTSLGRNMDNE